MFLNQYVVKIVFFLFGVLIVTHNLTVKTKTLQIETVQVVAKDTAKVCGEIINANYDNILGTIILVLNCEGCYERVNVIIQSDDDNTSNNLKENFYLGRNVCIVGKVIKSAGELKIYLKNKSQIKFDLMDNTIQNFN